MLFRSIIFLNCENHKIIACIQNPRKQNLKKDDLGGIFIVFADFVSVDTEYRQLFCDFHNFKK